MRSRETHAADDDSIVYVDEQEMTGRKLIQHYGRGHFIRGVAAKIRLYSGIKVSLRASIGVAEDILSGSEDGDDPDYISEEAQKAIATRHHYYTR
jgi:hypothetical protein